VYYNPSTQESKAELGVQGQPGLCHKTLSQKQNSKAKERSMNR
jgi:hypothetical protein